MNAMVSDRSRLRRSAAFPGTLPNGSPGCAPSAAKNPAAIFAKLPPSLARPPRQSIESRHSSPPKADRGRRIQEKFFDQRQNPGRKLDNNLCCS